MRKNRGGLPMNDLFKSMIEDHFYQEIFNSLQEENIDNYDQYNLTIRADVVQEVLETSVDNMEILKLIM